jgi:hypothetical protein
MEGPAIAGPSLFRRRIAMKRIAIFLACSAILVYPAVAAPLSADGLSAIRAGEAPQLTVANRQSVTALSSGNSVEADSVISGNVDFSQNAFSGFSGIGNIVVNTGNNNVIQGTLSVTVVGLP